MSSQNLVPFQITSVDSLGQGVSKITDKVTFVPKTLPGEKGIARILSAKSKVAFAQVEQLTEACERRQTPPCPHFAACSACHYLHTDYEYELELKLQGMKNLFRQIPDLTPQVIASPQRLGYRNRIQLHYDLSLSKLGLLHGKSHEIIEVSQCLIANDEVTLALKELYQDNKWLLLAPSSPQRGHVEIYFHQNQLKTTWNRSYAEGGFTQVNALMNEKLKTLVKTIAAELNPSFVLDLFAGNGNLTNEIAYQKRLCVDMYSESMPSEFYSLNLYSKNALKDISRKLSTTPVDLLILDPPRSGLKNLNEWLEMSSPRYVIYVSCDPHTQVRDISAVSNYQIKESFLLDLFPATFHFETMLFLERKD